VETTVIQEGQQVWQASRGAADTRETRRSFEAMRSSLLALRPADLVTVRVDPQRVAAIAHSVAVRDLVPARRAVFERLAAAGVYEINVLDALPDAAKSVWYARQQQQMGRAEASGASVPEEEIRLAYEVRGRMQYVLDYYVGDDPTFGARLKFVREGSGHQDLANDLQILSDVYQLDEVRAVIEHDTKRYRASDVDEARRLAGLIFTGFGVGQEGEAERWTGLFQRAVTLLLRGYDEHRAAGQFAFRRSEDVAATYPSLFAAVRSAPSRRAPAGEPSEGEGQGEPNEGESQGEPSGEGAGER
jgi:hypothetical protein